MGDRRDAWAMGLGISHRLGGRATVFWLLRWGSFGRLVDSVDESRGFSCAIEEEAGFLWFDFVEAEINVGHRCDLLEACCGGWEGEGEDIPGAFFGGVLEAVDFGAGLL